MTVRQQDDSYLTIYRDILLLLIGGSHSRVRVLAVVAVIVIVNGTERTTETRILED